MEGIAAPSQLNIERIFEVDRHSSLMLANVFERLLNQNSSADARSDSVQNLQDAPAQPSFKEVTE